MFQFGIEVTRQRLVLIFLGRRLCYQRPIPSKTAAQRIKEEGPRRGCLSILYENQGWFRTIHAEKYVSVPLPRRHGGKGRIPGGDPNLSSVEVMFARNALGVFEFGTDPPAKKVKGVGTGSQRDSETGESCYWSPEERARSGGPAPLPLDDGHDEILPLSKPVKEG